MDSFTPLDSIVTWWRAFGAQRQVKRELPPVYRLVTVWQKIPTCSQEPWLLGSWSKQKHSSHSIIGAMWLKTTFVDANSTVIF